MGSTRGAAAGATRPWRPPVLPRLPKLFQTTSLSQWRRRKLKTRKKRKNKERNKEDGNYCELTPKTSARISIEEELKIGRDDDWCTMVHGAWCMVHHGAWCMVHHGAWCMVHHGARPFSNLLPNLCLQSHQNSLQCLSLNYHTQDSRNQ